MSYNARQKPLSSYGTYNNNQRHTLLSNESSNESIEPTTPFDTDEIAIDNLWKQVRSKSKSSSSRHGPEEFNDEIPFIERQYVKGIERKECIAEGMDPSRKPLTRRKSLLVRVFLVHDAHGSRS